MTDTPDWADEAAASEMAIASALRVAGKNNEEAAELRGRIKGLWEAAEIVASGKDSAFTKDDVRLLKDRADDLVRNA